MDMKNVNNELARRVGLEIKNVKISPLFEKGKRYNINRGDKMYQLEDQNGTLTPEFNHCWLTWESLMENTDDETGVKTQYWSKQAYNFSDIESAKDAKNYIENLVK